MTTIAVLRVNGGALSMSRTAVTYDPAQHALDTDTFLFPDQDYQPGDLPLSPGVAYLLDIQQPANSHFHQASSTQVFTDASGNPTSVKRFEMENGAGGE